jgi:hypothetical protein
MTFEAWMKQVDVLGVREGVFDPPDAKYLCPGSKPRRPYTGKDGVFYELWESGVPIGMALGEALAAD